MARRQVSIYINGREIENSLKAIAAEKRKVNNELNKMVIGSEEYNDKMKELQKLNGILRDHNSALRPIANSYNKLPALLSGVAAGAAAAFTVDAVVNYGKKLFELGSQMELLGKKARTVFAQALPLVTREAEKNAQSMGFTTSAYIDAAAALGDLLIPMGFQREEAAKMSAETVNLAGALAEWTGGQFTAAEAAQSIGKALLGSRQELERYGIEIKQSELNAELASRGLNKLSGAALKQAEAMVTLELITRKSADAQAAFATNTDSLVRKQAELKARFAEIQERLATTFVPIFTKLLNLADGLANVLTGTASKIDKVGSASDKATEGVKRLQAEFNIEIETLKRGNLSKENRIQLINTINSKYGEYLPNLITEKDSLDQLTVAQEAANRAFAERITLLAFQAKFEELNTKLVNAKKEELDLQLRLTKAQKAQADGVKGIVTENANATKAAQNALVGSTLLVQKSISDNILEQKKLQQELENTKKLADDLGVDLLGKPRVAGGSAPEPKEDKKAKKDKLDKEAEELRKHLERLQALRDKAAEDAALAALDESNRRLERIRLDFLQQIQLAETLEAKGVQEATALRIELEQFRNEAIQKELDAISEENFKREEERLKKFAEKRDALQKKIEETVRTATAEDTIEGQRQLALERLRILYDDLIKAAQEYGLNVTALQAAQRAEVERINKEFDARELAAMKALQKSKLQAFQQSFSELSGAFSALYDELAEEESDFILLQKAATLAQIAVDTASAISSLVAVSESNPANAVTFGAAGIAQFAAGIIRITANLARARKLLDSGPALSQRKEGGYFDVTGAQDGQPYRARYLGEQQTGMLPSSPSLVLASERGPEYFVANEDLRNPLVMNYVRAIENIRLARTNQFVEGGATQPMSTPAGMPGMDAAIPLLQEISNKLDVLYARIDDQTVLDIQDRYRKIQNVSGGWV